MQNHKILSRLLAVTLVSLASVATISVQAADMTAPAPSATPSTAPAPSTLDATSGSGAASATGASSGSGATSATGAATTPSPTSAYADDAMITTMVKAALVEDKQVKSLKIKVTTEQGVVKVSGTVPNAEVGKRALQLAASVQGVKDVQSDLKVKAKG